MTYDTMKTRLKEFWRARGSRYEEICAEQKRNDAADRAKSDKITTDTLRFADDLMAAIEATYDER